MCSWDEVHRRAHARRFCPLPTTLHSPSGSNRLPLIFCSLCYSFAIFVIHSLRSVSVSFPSLMLFVCNICYSLLSSTAGSRRRCRYELSLSVSLISTSLRLLPRHRFRFRFDMISKWWQVEKPPRERRWRDRGARLHFNRRPPKAQSMSRNVGEYFSSPVLN